MRPLRICGAAEDSELPVVQLSSVIRAAGATAFARSGTRMRLRESALDFRLATFSSLGPAPWYAGVIRARSPPTSAGHISLRIVDFFLRWDGLTRRMAASFDAVSAVLRKVKDPRRCLCKRK